MEAHESNGGQAQLWNGSAGQAWADLQVLLDGMYRPFEPLLAAAVQGSDRRILDVGCGAGATTLALARRAGAGASCMGVDIAQPLIDLAWARAANEELRVDFACADAGSYPFEPGSMDLIVSRFGLMFFDDPVAAFTNLRRAARPGGRLDAIVWRSPDENPFMTAAERAAQDLLSLPARDPSGPGQFAFARRERVARILNTAAGRESPSTRSTSPAVFPPTNWRAT
ncbi:class I SAM-dependent methyltransferase [Massilia sp. Se16.2.3]|uniref:class I SAM-dependent methyltransferase n=1 Tax=Massilia sp. Se16.2.3 TaxID=2709303 RepID=UPI0035A6FDA1